MNKFKNFLLFFYLLFVPSILAEGFVAGTLIKTEAGPVPIEQIKEGDNVCAYGFDDCYYMQHVLFAGKKETSVLVGLTIDGELILTAPEQCFLKGLEEIWTPAANLQPGDKLRAFSGYLTIEKIEIGEIPAEIHTLSVVDFGNFFVSNHEIVAHNWVALVYAAGNGFLAFAATPPGQWILEKAAECGIYCGIAYYAKQVWSKNRQPPPPATSSGGGGMPPDDPNDPWRNYGGYKAPKNLGDWDSKITREKILPRMGNYERARNKALEIIGKADFSKSTPIMGKFGVCQGKVVGRQWHNGEVTMRLDYDLIKGPHINVTDYRMGKGVNGTSFAIPFNGTEETIIAILKHLQ